MTVISQLTSYLFPMRGVILYQKKEEVMVRSVTYNLVTTGARTSGAPERRGPGRRGLRRLRHKEAPLLSLSAPADRAGEEVETRAPNLAGTEEPQALLGSLTLRDQSKPGGHPSPRAGHTALPLSA